MSLDTVVPSKLRSGQKWDDVKEAFGETMLSEVRKHVTNLDDGNIINSVVHTPEDLFRDNRSFVNGSPTGGERTLAQWGAFRPFPGYSQYTPPDPRALYDRPALPPRQRHFRHGYDHRQRHTEGPRRLTSGFRQVVRASRDSLMPMSVDPWFHGRPGGRLAPAAGL